MIGDTRAIEATAEPVLAPPSRAVRAFVYGFLTIFLLFGAIQIECWPLTGFRLYATLKTEERISTRIVALLADGTSRDLDFEELPLGYRSTNRLLTDFPGMSQDERDAICDAWVQPLRDDGIVVVGVRVDEYSTHLGDPDSRTERVGELYRCGTE